ncbi:MAG: fibronectin type III domain-containing protein, partial [Planctomycetia bacterium]|nr:fibronectin type III domain-containing protein [Planctomycetia bacterium]
MRRRGSHKSARKVYAHRQATLAASVIEMLEQRQLLTGEPAVVANSFHFETAPHKISVQFDQDVSSSLGVGDLWVERLGSDTRVGTSNFSLGWNSSNFTATMTYTTPAGSQRLPSGRYRVTLHSSDLQNAEAQNLNQDTSFEFFYLNGDGNRDGVEDNADADIVSANLGLAGNFLQGDYDYSGVVDEDDLEFVNSDTLPSANSIPDGVAIRRVSDTTNEVGWIDRSENETGYRIQRSTNGVSWTTITTAGADTGHFVDTTVQAGVDYYYRIRTVRAGNDSFYSLRELNSVTAARATPGTGLGFQSGQVGSDYVNLTWVDTTSDEEGYEIYRSKDGGPWVRIARPSANSTSHHASSLFASTNYAFRIRSYNPAAVSPFYETQGMTLAGAPTALNGNLDVNVLPHRYKIDFNQPMNSASFDTSDLEILHLMNGYALVPGDDIASASYQGTDFSTTWVFRDASATPNDPNNLLLGGKLHEGNIEVLLGAGKVANVSNQSSSGDFFTTDFFWLGDSTRDRTVDLDDFTTLAANFGQSGRNFTQADFDYDGSVNLNDFTIVAAKFGSKLFAPPSGPNVLQATGYSKSSTRLEWSRPATESGQPLDGYRVWRSSDGVTWDEPVAEYRPSAGNPDFQSAAQNLVAWYDGTGPTGSSTAPLAEGTRYYYRVRAFSDSQGNGLATNKFPAVTTLSAPENLTATDVSATTVRLRWNDRAATELSYTVTAISAQGVVVRTIAGPHQGDVMFYEFDGLTPGVDYSFRVQAHNSVQMSAPSLPVDVQTPTGGEPLRIEGPNSASEGDIVTFDAVGGNNPGNSSVIRYVWSVSRVAANSFLQVASGSVQTPFLSQSASIVSRPKITRSEPGTSRLPVL